MNINTDNHHAEQPLPVGATRVTGPRLARFLLAGGHSAEVLNSAPASCVRPPDAVRLSQQLVRAAHRGVPPEKLSACLDCVRLDSLDDRFKCTAFWLNIYNALVFNAVGAFGVATSILEVPGFFNRAAYRVGGLRFSLNDIEHGILRGNRPVLTGRPPPFGPSDARLLFAVTDLDPRIHLALHCATRSCPATGIYSPATLDADLDAAAYAFVNGGGVERVGKGLLLSGVFAAYLEDFGGLPGLLTWLSSLVEEGTLYAVEPEAVAFADYDWSLSTFPAPINLTA